MKKYQIKEIKESLNHAGSKAVEDVALFAEQNNYKPLTIRTRTTKNKYIYKFINQMGYLLDWIKVFLSVEKKSIVFLQNPYRKRNFGREFIIIAMKKFKRCKFISIIHDIEELRGIQFSSYYKKEFNYMINNSDCLIVHNNKMREYIISKGYDSNKIVELGIFDYHVACRRENIQLEKSIAIAGNLDVKKSGYIYKLNLLPINFKINLFGPNFISDEFKNKNIKYHGSFKAEEVPGKLQGAFGLVWDGEDLDGCTGQTGTYLKYNNPHKTSLYLAAGLPIIVWKKSAMASFIQNEGIGLCVNSLEEISNIFEEITENEYNEMIKKTNILSERLKNGYYTKLALNRAENII